jgi:hypothetical protein
MSSGTATRAHLLERDQNLATVSAVLGHASVRTPPTFTATPSAARTTPPPSVGTDSMQRARDEQSAGVNERVYMARKRTRHVCDYLARNVNLKNDCGVGVLLLPSVSLARYLFSRNDRGHRS